MYCYQENHLPVFIKQILICLISWNICYPPVFVTCLFNFQSFTLFFLFSVFRIPSVPCFLCGDPTNPTDVPLAVSVEWGDHQHPDLLLQSLFICTCICNFMFWANKFSVLISCFWANKFSVFILSPGFLFGTCVSWRMNSEAFWKNVLSPRACAVRSLKEIF